MASDTEPISDLEAFGQAILVEMDRFAAAGYSFEKWHPLSAEQYAELRRKRFSGPRSQKEEIQARERECTGLGQAG